MRGRCWAVWQAPAYADLIYSIYQEGAREISTEPRSGAFLFVTGQERPLSRPRSETTDALEMGGDHRNRTEEDHETNSAVSTYGPLVRNTAAVLNTPLASHVRGMISFPCALASGDYILT